MIPNFCHPILRSINGGICPLCDVVEKKDPVAAPAFTMVDVTASPVNAIEGGDWRSNAKSVLGPIIANLPPEGSTPWPKLDSRSRTYRAPPVGVKPAIKYVADQAEKYLSHTEVIAERCRRSLAYFVRAYWPILMPGITLHWNWHLEQICNHVQGLLEEWIKKQADPSYVLKAQNLVINCPPRSLKSTIVSICAPAWMWLRFPSWKSIFVSANPKVAVRDARGCRACLETEWYQSIKATIAGQLPEGSPERAVLEWELVGTGDLEYSNTAGGVRMAMSFKAMVVGLGGDAIFVDDPNDARRALSEKDRAGINDTWDLSLCNRVNDYNASVRIMIMQRVHEMDLTGHWMTTMPPDMTVYIAIPLEFNRELDIENEKSPFGYHDPRTEDLDLLHPARLNHGPILEAERTRLGPYGFAGQMNQSPVPIEGGAFARSAWNFCYVSSPESHHHALTGSIVDRDVVKDSALAWQPAWERKKIGVRPKGCDMTRPSIPIPFLDRLIISADTSFGTEKETSSRVALGVIGFKGADRFLIENRTKVRNVPDTKDAIRQLVKDFPAVSIVLIERKASGHDVAMVLKSEISGVIPIDDNSNWMDRANGMLPSVLAGNWYLLEGAQWNTSIVNEFALFPNGAHDDQIDMCSQAAKYFFGTSGNNGTLTADW